jgi:uncharacterized protein (UPF0335 family)
MKKINTATNKFTIGNQSRVSVMFFSSLIALLALMFSGVNGVTAQVGQTAITGEWTAELRRNKSGEIQMNFHRRTEKGGLNMTGGPISLNEFQGIATESISSAKANVDFRIVREAGTFFCEGVFREGRGAGFWTFASSRDFVSAMRGRAYESLTEEDLLKAALFNLRTKFIEDLKVLGYDRLEFKQLLRAASHEVTPQYIREMQSAGFEGLTMEQLIRARNHDITNEYVKEVRAMGFGKQPLETLIRLRNHEITREFINQMRSAGFVNLSIEQLIRLRNHEITPGFVNDLKAEGYSDISVETAVRLKNRG